MRWIGRLRLSLWAIALGAVVLYVFFITLATIAPAKVAGVTAVVVVLAATLMLRGLRVARELADPGGDPRVRRALNKQRERRGF
jgi:predicted phage tail protein